MLSRFALILNNQKTLRLLTPYAVLVFAGLFFITDSEVIEAYHFGGPGCLSWSPPVCVSQSISVSGSTVKTTISTNNVFTNYYFWTYLYGTLDGNTQFYNPGTYKLGSGSSHTFTFTGIGEGTHQVGGDARLYWWNGSSWIYGGAISVSTVITILPPLPPPTTPTNFTFSPSSGVQGYTTTASWSASSGAERYEYYSPSLGVSAWTSLGNITSISFSTASLSPATYTAFLRACNSSGCSGSASASFTVQQPAPVAPSVSISPSTITTLQSATFSWGSASNASACTVFINNLDSGAVSCGGGSQTFPGSNLGIGTHTAYIRACNAGGCANSNPVTLTVTTAAPTSATISVDKTTVNVGEPFTLTYSGNNNPTSFRVYNCLGIGCVLTSFGNVTVTSETLVRSLADTYRFQIEACNSGGCSSRSNIVEVVVQARLPPFLRF